MSNIDKLALRRAAMWIRDEKWVHAGNGEVISEEYVANGETFVDHICNCEVVGTSSLRAEFIAAANPSNVLALLDELEAAEKRIAELEAREVTLPKPISVLHRRDFIDAHRTIYAYPEAEVNAALADAGINIAAAGKGE